ncbi:MAG: hypothetical protein JWM57_4123 [Phycisphaerales bacterium]|nr:hypothetical protein [Phycisphaerales bacterium]
MTLNDCVARLAPALLLALSTLTFGADRVGLVRLKTDPELGQNHPLLSRECFRQALLIEARDELGLTKRDEVLGEPVRGT